MQSCALVLLEIYNSKSLIRKESMEKDTPKICFRYRRELVLTEAGFSYLGRTFHTKVLRCPRCGLVFVDLKLAKGRMTDVEEQLEDK